MATICRSSEGMCAEILLRVLLFQKNLEIYSDDRGNSPQLAAQCIQCSLSKFERMSREDINQIDFHTKSDSARTSEASPKFERMSRDGLNQIDFCTRSDSARTSEALNSFSRVLAHVMGRYKNWFPHQIRFSQNIGSTEQHSPALNTLCPDTLANRPDTGWLWASTVHVSVNPDIISFSLEESAIWGPTLLNRSGSLLDLWLSKEVICIASTPLAKAKNAHQF